MNEPNPKKRRPLTPEEKSAADRAKKIWNEFKKEFESKTGSKMTQEAAGVQLGFAGQAAFSHYINARTPMNLETVIKLANFFKCKPQDISPELSKNLPADWNVDGKEKNGKILFSVAQSQGEPIKEPNAANQLQTISIKGKIPVIHFDHDEITKLITSPNQHTGEFMKTFMDFGEKCFGVILDERHRGLDQPGTVVVFDPDAEPTLDDDCYVLVSFPNIPDRYEIMRHIQYAGDLSLESLSGRAPPVSIRLTGAKIHARAIKRIGDL